MTKSNQPQEDYAMSIITQEYEKNQACESRISKFFSSYKIGEMLRKCGAGKEKGIAVVRIFRYLLCLMFSDRSMYMEITTKRFKEDYSKNTVYRFLNNSRINWERFTTMLSERIVNGFMRSLTDEEREDIFVIDDSAYHKRGYKKTELVAKVFDHVSMKYIKGFRMLSLGWSDGNSFVPITHRLLSSSKDKNVLGLKNDFDKRSIAFKRRRQAREKATDIMLDMLKQAQKAGHHAKYVLFDSWFSNPKEIIRISEDCHLNTIAMIKKSSKIHYEFEGEELNIKQIFARSKKRRGCSRYLLSVEVKTSYTDKKKVVHTIPTKIVCVRNRSNRKDWLAIICTDMALDEKEIIRIYGKRWDIEVFFKTCKQMLKLESECHSLSYDALTAHVAIVFTRYMLLSVEKRLNEDDRTVGELFFIMVDELQDITFNQSMAIIVQAFLDSIQELLHLSDEQINSLLDIFVTRLPAYLRDSLHIAQAA